MVGEGAYRALLFLYRRRFRREHRDPMLRLSRDARQDRRASWVRLTGDVVVTAPSSTRRRFAS
jgi:hypothetical protein